MNSYIMGMKALKKFNFIAISRY